MLIYGQNNFNSGKILFESLDLEILIKHLYIFVALSCNHMFLRGNMRKCIKQLAKCRKKKTRKNALNTYKTDIKLI